MHSAIIKNIISTFKNALVMYWSLYVLMLLASPANHKRTKTKRLYKVLQSRADCTAQCMEIFVVTFSELEKPKGHYF